MSNNRRIEIVHRKLGATTDGVTVVQNASESTEVTSPNVISHWAMRVESVAGGGREDDINTWQYFGLEAPNKFGWQVLMSTFRKDVQQVSLSEEKFTSLDSAGQRIAGYTLDSNEQIKTKAQTLIDTWGPYNLFRSNCQDFAVMLLCQTAYAIDDKEKVRAALTRGHGPLRLLPKSTLEKIGVDDSLASAEAFGQRIVVWDRQGKRLLILGEEVSEYDVLDLDDPEVLQKKIDEELYGTGSFRR